MPAPEEEGDLALLVAAAERGGRIALDYWRQEPKAWEKPDGAGPVSEADLAVNEALMRDLCTARPAWGWLSEETPDDARRLARDKVFIIDPIDGTRSFLRGSERFAISIAVATRGRVTAGVVHVPAQGLSYTATADGPARRNGAIIHARARDTLNGADLLTGRRNLAAKYWRHGAPGFHASFGPSLAIRLALVAEGAHDGMLRLREIWEWDCAAGTLIAERAGCRITDRRGRPLVFNQARPEFDGLICAPGALQEAIAAELAP